MKKQRSLLNILLTSLCLLMFSAKTFATNTIINAFKNMSFIKIQASEDSFVDEILGTTDKLR